MRAPLARCCPDSAHHADAEIPCVPPDCRPSKPSSAAPVLAVVRSRIVLRRPFVCRRRDAKERLPLKWDFNRTPREAGGREGAAAAARELLATIFSIPMMQARGVRVSVHVRSRTIEMMARAQEHGPALEVSGQRDRERVPSGRLCCSRWARASLMRLNFLSAC